MPPKRPVEVLVLDDSDDETPAASSSLTSASSRSASRVGGGSVGGGPASGADEQFEQDLARAMALSLSQEEQVGREQPAPAAGASRAEMERARLERQKMRELAGLDTPGKKVVAAPVGNKRMKVTTLEDLPHDGEASTNAAAASTSSSPFRTVSSHASVSGSSSAAFTPFNTSSSKHSQRFWTGSLKRVPNAWHPDPDSWSFADLIGPSSSLQAAIVSAFCLDPTWVVPHFPEQTPLLLIMPRAKGDAAPELAQCDLKANTYRVVPPERSPNQFAGVMHIKFMVYYHDTFCRIVIPTANAVPYDYESMDNALWIQDFPLQACPPTSQSTDEGEPFKNPTHTQFSKTFIQCAYELKTPKKFLKFSSRYDFSASQDVKLVQTLQGKWSFRDPKELGKGGGIGSLAKAVASLRFAKGGRWEIEATGSSIGKYSSTWLSQFYAACLGVHPSSYFEGGKKSLPPHDVVPTQGATVKLPIKIMFPTQDAILNSWKGAEHGGTLFCPTKTWNSPNFPKHLFHRGESKRDRVPAHTKIILALHKYKNPTDPAAVHEGWMYVGSHNLTPSAWGALQKGASGPQLANNNYEMGVVFPIRASSATELERKASELVTYRRPLVPYSASDLPWQQELFLEV
ncbi:hypothetical protein JCM10213_004999 [Rhodosporidiobolus nylandii]